MKKLILFLSLSVLFACKNQKTGKVNYLSTKNESLEETFEHFQSAKFGLFIHWGLYSIPGGVWNGEEIPWLGEHIQRLGKISVKDYEKLAEQFNPTAFDADFYARLAKEAGMKYMVITSKHHDGYALFKSAASPYNCVDGSPYGKDIVKELALACHKQDLPFGLYYSQAMDWHHPAGVGNTLDFPEKTSTEEYEPYLQEKAFPQIDEITSNYGPLFLLWFDTPKGLSQEQAKALAKAATKNQPGMLVTDRIGFNMGTYAQMGDNAIPTQVKTDRYWETPATLNDTWGFKYNDTNWKNTHDLVFKLTDIVSKGGNYLLNIGPDGSGKIPDASVKILREMGAWLKTNGEAIYGTQHSPFYIDNIQWRCTQKPHTLYFHALQKEDKIEAKGLKSKVRSATLLADSTPLTFSQDGETLTIDTKGIRRDQYNTVIKVSIEDEVPQVAADYRYDAKRKRHILYALEARYRGEGTYYDWPSNTCTNLHATLYWYLHNVPCGTYKVKAFYACDDEKAGSAFLFDAMEGFVHTDKPLNAAGHIEATQGKIKSFDLPAITVSEESHLIAFHLLDEASLQANISHFELIMVEE